MLPLHVAVLWLRLEVFLAQLTEDAGTVELAQALLSAVGGGQWTLLAVLLVFIITVVAKRAGAHFWKPLGTPVAAAVIAVVSSVALAAVNAGIAYGAQGITWQLVVKALLVALAALLPSAARPISEADKRMLAIQAAQNHLETTRGGPQP